MVKLAGESEQDSIWKRWFNGLYVFLTAVIKHEFISISSAQIVDNPVTLVDTSGGSITVTLPLAGSFEKHAFIVKDTDSGANAVTIGVSGSDTIDGGATLLLSSSRGYAIVFSDGDEWHRIG